MIVTTREADIAVLDSDVIQCRRLATKLHDAKLHYEASIVRTEAAEKSASCYLVMLADWPVIVDYQTLRSYCEDKRMNRQAIKPTFQRKITRSVKPNARQGIDVKAKGTLDGIAAMGKACFAERIERALKEAELDMAMEAVSILQSLRLKDEPLKSLAKMRRNLQNAVEPYLFA